MKALVLRNLRHQRRILSALCAGLFAFEIVLLQIGASFERQGGIEAIFELLPPLLKKLLEPQLKMASFEGMVAFGFQHPGILIAAVGYVLTTGSSPAADRDEGTLELFLARPLARSRYLSAQLLTVLCTALALGGSIALGNSLGLLTVEVDARPPILRYLPCALNLGFLLVFFGSVSLLTATRAQRRGSALAWSIGFALTTFIFEALAPIAAWPNWLRHVSPFFYFQPLEIGVEGVFPWRDLLVLAIASLLATWAAFRSFQARDL